MFGNIKTIIRQGEELCKLRNEIEDLKIDLAIQKSIRNQHAKDVTELLKKLNISNRKLSDIKYIVQTETNEYTAYRKIKNVIFDAQIER